MKYLHPRRLQRQIAGAAMAATMLIAVGCKKTVSDDTLNTDVHNALVADPSIAQEQIQSSVTSGVVTLTGNVTNDTARLVAAQDAARITGVKEVVNNLAVAGQALAPTVTSPSAPATPRPATPEETQTIAQGRPLSPPPPGPTHNAPPPPPAPVFHDVTVAAGRDIPVRITETLSSETSQVGQRFTGVVDAPIIVDGQVAIPAGSGVEGHVSEAHDAGHYKGNSLLGVVLTSIDRHGEHIHVSTNEFSEEGKGRGRNSAEKIGGGAAVGAILGGIFGGGKGAAIGAAAGGGGGAVLNGVTRGQQVSLPAETLVRFRLTNSFTVRSAGPANNANGGLQRR